MTQAPDRFSAETLTLLANEFNAPLASLNALLTTLMAGDHGEVSLEILTTLRNVDATHKRLSRVVSDVLDAARMEHGQFAVSIEQVVLHDILSRAEEEIQAEVERKHLTLSREGSDTVTLAADREHLQRIFTALLRNAVQYTEQGGITITAAAEPERVTITIADTGVGIQTAALGRLFAKPKLGMLLRGKGMSLYLARGLAQLMGGDVTLISSDLEVGSTFAVTLPRQARAASAAKPEPSVSVKA
jgi:signal transduction histidine kinase